MPYFVKPVEEKGLTVYAVCCDEIFSGGVLVAFPSERKSQSFKKFLEKQNLVEVPALMQFLKEHEVQVKDCAWAKACEQARKNLEAMK